MAKETKNNQDVLENIDVNLIDPDPGQPRQEFRDEDLENLAKSIKLHGQKNPIRIRPFGKRFRLIGGEMRLRAAQLVKLPTILAIITHRNMTEEEVLLDQLVDNTMRTDLKPSEEAHAFQRLMDLNKWQTKELAKVLNLTLSRVTDTLNLLKLPTDILADIDSGRINRGSGYQLARLPQQADQIRLAKKLLEKGLTAGELKAHVRTILHSSHSTHKKPKGPNRFFRWKAALGRGISLFLISKDSLDPHEVIGNTFDGLVQLMEQEFPKNRPAESIDFDIQSIKDLIAAFSSGGAELEIDLNRCLGELGAAFLLKLLSPLSSSDRKLRAQAVDAFEKLPLKTRVALAPLIKIAQGREQEL